LGRTRRRKGEEEAEQVYKKTARSSDQPVVVASLKALQNRMSPVWGEADKRGKREKGQENGNKEESHHERIFLG